MHQFVAAGDAFHEETGANVAEMACAEGAGGPFHGVVGGVGAAEGEKFDGEEGCAEGEVRGGRAGCV